MIDYRIQTFLVLYETMNYRQTAQLLRVIMDGAWTRQRQNKLPTS